MTDNATSEPTQATATPLIGTCPNEHEHDVSEFVIADYGKCWRVRCETCRIIYSLSKK